MSNFWHDLIFPLFFFIVFVAASYWTVYHDF